MHSKVLGCSANFIELFTVHSVQYSYVLQLRICNARYTYLAYSRTTKTYKLVGSLNSAY